MGVHFRLYITSAVLEFHNGYCPYYCICTYTCEGDNRFFCQAAGKQDSIPWGSSVLITLEEVETRILLEIWFQSVECRPISAKLT